MLLCQRGHASNHNLAYNNYRKMDSPRFNFGHKQVKKMSTNLKDNFPLLVHQDKFHDDQGSLFKPTNLVFANFIWGDLICS